MRRSPIGDDIGDHAAHDEFMKDIRRVTDQRNRAWFACVNRLFHARHRVF